MAVPAAAARGGGPLSRWPRSLRLLCGGRSRRSLLSPTSDLFFSPTSAGTPCRSSAAGAPGSCCVAPRTESTASTYYEPDKLSLIGRMMETWVCAIQEAWQIEKQCVPGGASTAFEAPPASMAGAPCPPERSPRCAPPRLLPRRCAPGSPPMLCSCGEGPPRLAAARAGCLLSAGAWLPSGGAASPDRGCRSRVRFSRRLPRSPRSRCEGWPSPDGLPSACARLSGTGTAMGTAAGLRCCWLGPTAIAQG